MADAPTVEAPTAGDARRLTWEEVRDRIVAERMGWLATIHPDGHARFRVLTCARGEGRPVLFLAYEETGEVDASVEGPWTDAVVLRPGLLLLDSEATRSEVYHALKHHLPERSALLVAPLADAPKMMGMADGSTTWLRARGRAHR